MVGRTAKQFITRTLHRHPVVLFRRNACQFSDIVQDRLCRRCGGRKNIRVVGIHSKLRLPEELCRYLQMEYKQTKRYTTLITPVAFVNGKLLGGVPKIVHHCRAK